VTIVAAIAAHLESDGDTLATQAANAIVTSMTPGYIDLSVADTHQRGPWRDGPLDCSPTVIDSSGNPAGGILIWISDGRLSMIEQFWYTDEPPTGWPTVESLSFE